MEKYNYLAEVATDVQFWMADCEQPFNLSHFEDREDAHEFLYDELWNIDDITGNGPNGYAGEYQCETFLTHNIDLIIDACDYFNVDYNTLRQQYKKKNLARYLDCTIRCYLLNEAIGDALEAWEQISDTKYKNER